MKGYVLLCGFGVVFSLAAVLFSEGFNKLFWLGLALFWQAELHHNTRNDK